MTSPFTVDGDARVDEAASHALVDLLYQLADDELVIGHRASEWLGVAPDIEEDVAFSSIAQDEVGHASFYYKLLEDLGQGSADRLAFERPAVARRSAVFVEHESGDWASTIVRHYFYDVFEDIRLTVLAQSSYQPLRHGAVKIHREEYYHKLHHELWFRRLAVAGGEAADRMNHAVSTWWPELYSLFDLGPYTEVLLEHGIFPATPEALRQRFETAVRSGMNDVGLWIPSTNVAKDGGRSAHTRHLDTLLATMSEVHDIDRSATW